MELGLAYKFDWSVLWREPYGRWMLQGIWVTIQLGLISWVIALGLGTLVGTLRITPWRILRAIGTLYVEIFRNIPFMVQLFFWYFAGPSIAGFVFGQQVEHWLNTMPHVQFYTAIFALGIYTASRIGCITDRRTHSVRIQFHLPGPVPRCPFYRTYPDSDVSICDYSLCL